MSNMRPFAPKKHTSQRLPKSRHPSSSKKQTPQWVERCQTACLEGVLRANQKQASQRSSLKHTVVEPSIGLQVNVTQNACILNRECRASGISVPQLLPIDARILKVDMNDQTVLLDDVRNTWVPIKALEGCKPRQTDHSFVGRWFDKENGHMFAIEVKTATWAEGTIWTYSEHKCLRKCGGKVLQGKIHHDGSLSWSNGEMWQRATDPDCKFPEHHHNTFRPYDWFATWQHRPVGLRRLLSHNQDDFTSLGFRRRFERDHDALGFDFFGHTVEDDIPKFRHSGYFDRDCVEDDLANFWGFRSLERDNATEQMAKSLGLDAATYKRLKELEKRDISPEDYDLLGMLDEGKSVPKLSNEQLERFSMQTYEPLLMANVENCALCCATFHTGEKVRNLQCCKHALFHSECIDPWLLERSDTCPLCKKTLV